MLQFSIINSFAESPNFGSPVKKGEDIRGPLLWAGLVALGMLVGVQLDDELPESMISSEPTTGLDRLQRAIHFVEEKYGEPSNLDSVAEDLIPQLMEGLDPHSYYLSGKQLTYFNDQYEGNYKGIGIEYGLLNDTVYVLNVSPESPAQQSGLRFGDRIMAIDSTQISGRGLTEAAVRKVWNSTQEILTLEIRSKKTDSTLTLTKSAIETSSVPIAQVLNGDIGYLRVDRFGANTYADFMSKLEQLIQQGLKHLLIDVRDNPGGALDQTIKIVDQFIPKKGVLLAYIEGKNLRRTEFKSTANVFFKVEEVVVLVNENSVSASEVLAGIFQDLDRATIMGSRTYGKALVQETFSLSDESAINLTIGRYYLPSGRHLQRDYGDREKYEQRLRVVDDNDYVVSDKGERLPVGQGVIPDVTVVPNSKLDPAERTKLRKALNDFLLASQLKDDDQTVQQASSRFMEMTSIDTSYRSDIQAMTASWLVHSADVGLPDILLQDPLIAAAVDHIRESE